MRSRAAEPIRVLIADGHPLYRAGLAEAIKQGPRLELVGQVESGPQALEEISRLKPDVAILDVELRGLSGIEIVLLLASNGQACRVLFLSACLEGETVYRAIEAGARGYLSKDSAAGTICDAVAGVADGRVVLAPDIQEAIAEQIRVRTTTEPRPLTARELEILSLIADGLSVAEIAGRLYLSPFTIKTHIKRTYRKLGVSSRGAAVAEAMRRGLFEVALFSAFWPDAPLILSFG
jgi:two-component system nitrate/nitrite response regulator NarL